MPAAHHPPATPIPHDTHAALVVVVVLLLPIVLPHHHVIPIRIPTAAPKRGGHPAPRAPAPGTTAPTAATTTARGRHLCVVLAGWRTVVRQGEGASTETTHARTSSSIIIMTQASKQVKGAATRLGHVDGGGGDALVEGLHRPRERHHRAELLVQPVVVLCCCVWSGGGGGKACVLMGRGGNKKHDTHTTFQDQTPHTNQTTRRTHRAMVAAEKAPSSSSPACSGKCTTPLVASRAAATCPAATCYVGEFVWFGGALGVGLICAGRSCVGGLVVWFGGMCDKGSRTIRCCPKHLASMYVMLCGTCVTRRCSASAAEGRPSQRAISVR